MDSRVLVSENIMFHGTRGVSANNRHMGFLPAFLQKSTGRIELARLQDGKPASIHLIQWLPSEWAESKYDDGSVQSLAPDIISGFVNEGVFYTREEVTAL